MAEGVKQGEPEMLASHRKLQKKRLKLVAKAEELQLAASGQPLMVESTLLPSASDASAAEQQGDQGNVEESPAPRPTQGGAAFDSAAGS